MDDKQKRQLREFTDYLRNCTDRQVVGVYEKEKKARRNEYVLLVEMEASRRGLTL